MANNEHLDSTNQARRTFLRRFGQAIGGGALASVMSTSMISTAIAFPTTGDSSTSAGKVFSQPAMLVLKHICATVIPTTDTPGAHEVNTHGFIDNQLFHCFPKKVQKSSRNFIEKINASATQRYGNQFVAITEKQKFELLTDIEMAQKEFSKQDRKLFKHLKGLIAFGYYTSEVGGSQELRHLPVPGGFKGSIPFKSTDRAWS